MKQPDNFEHTLKTHLHLGSLFALGGWVSHQYQQGNSVALVQKNDNGVYVASLANAPLEIAQGLLPDHYDSAGLPYTALFDDEWGRIPYLGTEHLLERLGFDVGFEHTGKTKELETSRLELLQTDSDWRRTAGNLCKLNLLGAYGDFLDVGIRNAQDHKSSVDFVEQMFQRYQRLVRGMK